MLDSIKPTKSGYQPDLMLVSPPYQARDQMCWADPVTTDKPRTQAEADSIRGPVGLAVKIGRAHV